MALWSLSSLLPILLSSFPYLWFLSSLMHAEYRKQTNCFPKAFFCATLLLKNLSAYVLSCSVVPNSLQPHGQRLLCPWDFPGRNTRMACHFLLQRILWLRDQTHISWGSCIGRQIPYHWATWEALKSLQRCLITTTGFKLPPSPHPILIHLLL